jgi:hypothetical protein
LNKTARETREKTEIRERKTSMPVNPGLLNFELQTACFGFILFPFYLKPGTAHSLLL